jgi:hypothetical protein
VALLALIVGGAGAVPLAGLLLLASVGLALYARHWLALAGRSRVGARSEDDVQRALAPLQSEGWRLGHSLRWQGRGDIDSDAIAPNGIVVAIETKRPEPMTVATRSGARSGGVALAAPAKMGPQWRPGRHVPCSCAGRRARRA